MSIALSPGTVVGDRFEIKSELGQGAFATTYLAADAQDQSEVAVKVVSVTQLKDWKAFELFEREVEVLQSLKPIQKLQFGVVHDVILKALTWTLPTACPSQELNVSLNGTLRF